MAKEEAFEVEWDEWSEWDDYEEAESTEGGIMAYLDATEVIEYREEAEGLEDLGEWIVFENYDSTDDSGLLDDVSEEEILEYLIDYDADLEAAFETL